MQIGIIGLGKMGSRIAEKLSKDHEVFVWNRTPEDIFQLQKSAQVTGKDSIKALIESLNSPKVIWIMVPHAAVEEVLTEVKGSISKGDIVVDGGNSFYKDTERRFKEFEKMGTHFLGVGVSGGILASKNGYPLMVGGSKNAYDRILPILETLSQPNGGHEFLGTGGAGHFVKMIHNGVEYGMMQSLGEGFDVLKNSKYQMDISKVARIWKKGTIISGFLVDRASEMLDRDPELSEFDGVVSRSGEGDWTIEAAAEEGLNIPAIEASVYYRKDTETEESLQKSFTAKVLNALRRAFGGHEVKKI